MDVRSEGRNDPGKHGRGGKTFIWVNGRDLSKHRRGINVVVVDYFTGMLWNQLFLDNTM